MVKLGVRLALAAAVLGLGYWAWTVFFPSPQKIIRGRLEQMAKLASFTDKEGVFTKAANSQKLASFFALHVEVRVDAPGIENETFNSREDIYTAILAARSAMRTVRTQLLGIVIEMTPGSQEAIANAALRADLGDQKDAVVEQLKFTFKNIDGEWLVTSVVSEK